MAQFDFAKVRAVEDQLTGNNFGWVTIEWRMEPAATPDGQPRRVYRIRTEMVNDQNVTFNESASAAMDEYVAGVRGRLADRKHAAEAEAAALEEAQSTVDAQFPVVSS